MPAPGSLLETFVFVQDEDGPILGATLSFPFSDSPLNVPFDSLRIAWSEQGNGDYRVTYQTLSTEPAGDYHLRILADDANESSYSQVWVLDAVGTLTPAGVTSSSGTSRRQIRRSVANMLHDYHFATDNTGGETSQFQDTITLARPTNYFQGMQVLFANPASANYGHVATVTVSDGPSRALSFEPPLPAASISGEQIEMYNFRGRGTTYDLYNAAINDAIMQARQQHAPVPYSFTLTDLFASTSPYITIPAEFTYFTGLDVVGYGSQIYDIKAGDLEVDRFNRRIRVKGRYGINKLNGYYPTLRGFAAPALLDDDDDLTNIDVEWLFSEVKAQVLERLNAAGMAIGLLDRLYLQERNEATGKRTMIIPRFPPSTVRLF